jgi:DNA-binding MarR family transcriptional regulator
MSETPDIENDLAGRMRTVIGRLGRRLRHAGGHTDLSPSQYEVFGTIARREDLRLSELAMLEGINPTLLSRIVAKLEADALVSRENDPDDRRVSHVMPTAKGRELYEQIRLERTDAVSLAIERLTPRERQSLEHALPVLEALAKSLKQPPQ